MVLYVVERLDQQRNARLFQQRGHAAQAVDDGFVLLLAGRAGVLPHLRDERGAAQRVGGAQRADQRGLVLAPAGGVVEYEKGGAEGGQLHDEGLHRVAQRGDVGVSKRPRLQRVEAVLLHDAEGLLKGEAGKQAGEVERKAHGLGPPLMDDGKIDAPVPP